MLYCFLLKTLSVKCRKVSFDIAKDGFLHPKRWLLSMRKIYLWKGETYIFDFLLLIRCVCPKSCRCCIACGGS